MSKTQDQINELKKRIEELEKRQTQSVPPSQPYPIFINPQQLYWCQYCQRYNCGQIHIIC